MFGCFTCASIATILLAPCINILTSLFEKLVNLFVLAKLVHCFSVWWDTDQSPDQPLYGKIKVKLSRCSASKAPQPEPPSEAWLHMSLCSTEYLYFHYHTRLLKHAVRWKMNFPAFRTVWTTTEIQACGSFPVGQVIKPPHWDECWTNSR